MWNFRVAFGDQLATQWIVLRKRQNCQRYVLKFWLNLVIVVLETWDRVLKYKIVIIEQLTFVSLSSRVRCLGLTVKAPRPVFDI